jgi:hypothetical protein
MLQAVVGRTQRWNKEDDVQFRLDVIETVHYVESHRDYGELWKQ